MNKSQLIQAISDSKGLSVEIVADVVNAFVDLTGDTLAAGEPMRIQGFGKWVKQERKATQRRNPRTGEKLTVPAKQTVIFRASPVLKDRLNEPDVAPA